MMATNQDSEGLQITSPFGIAQVKHEFEISLNFPEGFSVTAQRTRACRSQNQEFLL